MNVINCPCCRRQLRVHQEMTRQRVKCRYCGAIFAATTSLHDQQPRMEEPAFAPRETIVNTSAPAVARDAEILSPEKLVHSTRGKIAAISAPPEQLPLTENPAIGKRDELELDELIPNTSPVVEALPAAEATAPATRATAPSVEKKKHIGLIAVILGGAIVLLAVGLTWWTQT